MSEGAYDPLHPTSTILVKLGSALVHAEEAISPGGHQFDVDAIRGIVSDPEIIAWREAMDVLALLPKQRGADV